MSSIELKAVSYDLAGAAKATGLSDTTIRAAVDAKELVAHYQGRKPVFRAVDLDEWIRSLPTERKAAS
jgi:excisionase family DNA binding protein